MADQIFKVPNSIVNSFTGHYGVRYPEFFISFQFYSSTPLFPGEISNPSLCFESLCHIKPYSKLSEI